MLELGKHTKEAHNNIGKIASQNLNGNRDVLVVVGPRAGDIKAGAIEMGMKIESILEFINSTDAGEYMKDFIKAGDLVLVKGSQGMRMERTVLAILADKTNSEKLLVRQDKEWQSR